MVYLPHLHRFRYVFECLMNQANHAECTGVIWAALLSPTRKVRRSDATPVPTSGDLTWAQEFKALWKHLLHPRVCSLGIPFGTSC